MGATAWAVPSPAAKYALPQSTLTPVDSQLPAVAGPSAGAGTASSPFHPDSALFWFAIIAAVSFGLMATSTTVRVGKAAGSVSVGKA